MVFQFMKIVANILQDDDSDLEFELEATPTVNHESSAEAAACVKVFYIATFLDCVSGIVCSKVLVAQSDRV